MPLVSYCRKRYQGRRTDQAHQRIIVILLLAASAVMLLVAMELLAHPAIVCHFPLCNILLVLYRGCEFCCSSGRKMLRWFVYDSHGNPEAD